MKKLKYLLLTKSAGLYINLLSFVRPARAQGLAYKLFSNPRLGRLMQHSLPEVLRDSHRETFTFEGQGFQTYTWKGTPDSILLVHGWESNSSRWEKLIPYLQATGYTIIALDAPAHGLSDGSEFNVPRYAEFIQVAVSKFSPKHLIGHSIGGAACVYFQSKYQNESLRSIVLLGAPSDLSVLLMNYVKLLSLNSRTVTLLEQYFLERFQFKPDEFSGQIFGRSLKLRGLIAHDITDTVVAIDEAYKIASSWPDSILVETTGLGHSMHDAALYEKIGDFLKAQD